MSSSSEWLNSVHIAIVGLGYVGLPLAVEFSKKFPVTGFDIKSERVEALREGRDETLETEPEELRAATQLCFSTEIEDLRACTVYIVTVPTPVDAYRRPDLQPLMHACETVGQVLKRGDTVIFESTVYPGCTKEVCIPILERMSRLELDLDFNVGYSPERINPGDKEHRLTSIMKVTSGSTPKAAALIDSLYGQIITAGTFLAESIEVAEAAKVIENTQRDLNIALINELAIIFNRLGIDTEAVLNAAGSKWNFLPFRPGLVGGHCIGVDPYYLTHRAEMVGYNPEIILAGRRLNDNMARYVASQLVKAMLRRQIQVDGARALVLGLSFKENCPDLRNSKVVDLIKELGDYGIQVDAYDPMVNPYEVERQYGITPIEAPRECEYDAIVLAVAHSNYGVVRLERIRNFGKSTCVIYDLKHKLDRRISDLRL